MTDRRFPSNATPDDIQTEIEQDQSGTPAAQDETGDTSRAATFRRDGGPGSVMRERQPGFGGLDAREAEAGREHWQNVTSNQYGQRLETVEEEHGPDDLPEPPGEAPPR